MLILDLECVRPEAGVVLEWVPTSVCRAAAAESVPRDGVEPTLLQLVHLQVSLTRAQQGLPHIGYLGTSSEVPHTLGAEQMAEAYRRFVVRHEILRTSYRPTDGGYAVTVVDPEVVAYEPRRIGAVDEHGVVTVDADGWSGTMREFLARHMGACTDPFSWPVASLIGVDRPGSMTLQFVCDHAVSDGVSQALALNELLAHYRAVVDGVESPLLSAPAESFLDYAVSERRRAAEGDGYDLVDDTVNLFGRNGNAMPTFAADLGLEPGQLVRTVGTKYPLLDSEEANHLELSLRERGFRLFPALFAMMAITDYETTGKNAFFALTVRNSRGPSQVASQGWFCRYAPVAFDIDDTTTFGDLLTVADAAVRRGRELSAAPLEAVVARLLAVDGIDPSGVLAEPQMVSYLDFRWFPGAGDPAYDNSFIFAGDVETANALMWFNRDQHHLYLDTQVPGTDRARRIVRGWHQHFAAVLSSVMQTGDYHITGAGGRHVVDAFARDDSPFATWVLDPLRGSDDPLIAGIIAKADAQSDPSVAVAVR